MIPGYENTGSDHGREYSEEYEDEEHEELKENFEHLKHLKNRIQEIEDSGSQTSYLYELVHEKDELERRMENRINEKMEKLRFGEENLSLSPEEKILKIREHSDYWAEQFSEQLQRIHEQKQKDRDERERAQGDPKAEEMQEHKDAAEHATKTSTDDRYRELNTKLDMAMEGVMPDDLSNIQREYDGLRTEGGEFVEAQDRLKDEIENGGLSMDEAFALLERQRERGEISEDGYSYLHWFIMDHFEP